MNMSNETNEVTKTDKKVKVTRGDLRSVWLRNTFAQASWNYERMQNLGFLYTLIPVFKRLYKTKDQRAEACKRHMEFYNTHPYMTAPVLGVVAVLEEEKAAGTDIDDQTINGVKVGMMGPLAGVGDPIFWGTLRPVIGAFAASLALSGSILGPLVFFVLWNVVRMAFLWFTQDFAYKQGVNISQNLSGGLLNKITYGASVLGMFVMGVLVPRWTSINLALPISTTYNSGTLIKETSPGVWNYFNVDQATGAVSQVSDSAQLSTADAINCINAGKCTTQPETVNTLQHVLDTMLPGLMPLLLMLAVMALLRRKVNPLVIIICLFIVGIGGYAIGLLG
jgi:PTS system mannose-specific IID component